MLKKLSAQQIERVTSQPAIGPSVNAQEIERDLGHILQKQLSIFSDKMSHSRSYTVDGELMSAHNLYQESSQH